MPSALAAGRFDEITALDYATDTRLPRMERFKDVKAEAVEAAEMKKD